MAQQVGRIKSLDIVKEMEKRKQKWLIERIRVDRVESMHKSL
jgi:hypothetical protein